MMTEIANRHIQAQYLSDWSLVRLPDGRVGVFTRRDHQGRVTLPGQTGIDVSLDEMLDLVKHPAELAAEALDRHYADECRRAQRGKQVGN